MFGINYFIFLVNYAEGKLNGGINQEGVKYYNNLINELIANGQNPNFFYYIFFFNWSLHVTFSLGSWK